MIAPFWADVDTRDFVGGDDFEFGFGDEFGDVRETSINNVWFREEFSSALLSRAERDIKEAYVDQANYKPSWLFIVTWDSVGYYSRRIDKVS